MTDTGLSMMHPLRLDAGTLMPLLKSGQVRPLDVVEATYARIAERGDDKVWTYVRPREQALAEALQLESRLRSGLPLYGLTFGVKDNIDVAGVPTAAGCADWSYTPALSSPVIDRLRDAGAIFIGKTNLDQFANGLVGVRCPAGYCRNAIHPDYIPGGSSSGSAVAVACGAVSFALGTDTGGSGRVPAGLNNVVGLKPTCGSVSSRGLFYANRSLDCVTVFALTADDAFAVYETIRGYDPEDPFSRIEADSPRHPGAGTEFQFAVPDEASLEFFGDRAAADEFERAVSRLESMGGKLLRIPFQPFLEAGRLLFEGPWIVERWLATKQAIDAGNPQLNPATQAVLESAKRFSAGDIFLGQQKLMRLRRECANLWRDADILVVPTTGSIFRLRDVEADPVRMNARNGFYTYFANLLDLCGMAVPSGFRPDGLPFGICILARAFEDASAYSLARRYHGMVGGRLGATDWVLTARNERSFV